MDDLLIYTFKSFKNVDILRQAGYDIFIFNKLVDEISRILQMIDSKSPKYMLGLANIRRKSRWERYTVNQFNKNGKVSKNNPTHRYGLHVPQNKPFYTNRHIFFAIGQCINYQNTLLKGTLN